MVKERYDVRLNFSFSVYFILKFSIRVEVAYKVVPHIWIEFELFSKMSAEENIFKRSIKILFRTPSEHEHLGLKGLNEIDIK